MRRLVSLILVAGLALGADQLVTAQAEQRASAQATAALAAPAEVTLHGWPVSLRLLAGRVPEAVLRARDVPVGEAGRLTSLEVTLVDVRVGLGGAAAEGGLPAAGDGRFRAELDAAALAALLGPGAGVTDLVIGSGTVTLGVPGVPGTALAATPRAAAGVLVLQFELDEAVALPLPSLTVDLSGLPGSPSVDAVSARPGLLVITGALRELPRELPE